MLYVKCSKFAYFEAGDVLSENIQAMKRWRRPTDSVFV